VTFSLAKVVNLIIGLAMSEAARVATSMGEAEIRKALRKAGLGKDPVTAAAVGELVRALKGGVLG
jgi:hypothetical protein